MAQETINSIRAAELKAQQILSDAESQKSAILAKAREEVRTYEADIIAKANGAAKDALNRVSAEKGVRIDSAEKEAEAVIAQHQEGKEAKRAEAIRLVISEIA